MSLAELLAEARLLDSGFGMSVPADWLQGRTAYGGFSAALALTAALRAGGAHLPPLRSAQVSFVGPLYGELEVTARVLRLGKNATWVAAEVLREGEVSLLASFVFMGPVPSSLHLDDRPVPTGLIAPETAKVLVPNPMMPAFIQQLEIRFALPPSAEKQPELCWWVRLKDRSGLDAMSELMLIADALPSGALPLLDPGTPASSMTWQMNLLDPAPTTRDGWWLLRSRADFAENGGVSQAMHIWNADGAAIASGMQAVAVFG